MVREPDLRRGDSEEVTVFEGPPVPRFVPEEAFPPYSYVPGCGRPHPTSDPAGHSFGRRTPAPPLIDPEHWRQSRAYLRGFDLWNHRDFWEAHECWEALWHVHGRRGDVADHLKALIKLAASGVKQREGVPGGVRTHARRAAELWRRLARDRGMGERFLGFRLGDLVNLADAISREGWPSGTLSLVPTEFK